MQGKSVGSDAQFAVPRPPTRAAGLSVEDAERLSSQLKPMWEEVAAPPDPPTMQQQLVQEKTAVSSDGATVLAAAVGAIAPPKETKVAIHAEEPTLILGDGVVAMQLPDADPNDPYAGLPVADQAPPSSQSPEAFAASAPPVELPAAAPVAYTPPQAPAYDDEPIAAPKGNRTLVYAAVAVVGVLGLGAIFMVASGGSSNSASTPANQPASTATTKSTSTDVAAATAKATPLTSASAAPVATAPAKTVDINDLAPTPVAKEPSGEGKTASAKPEKQPGSESNKPEPKADPPKSDPPSKPTGSKKKPGEIVRETPF